MPLLGYYLRLAAKTLTRNPGLTALMVGAIALGIAIAVTTLTEIHLLSGDPIWWKSKRLYAVTMDDYPLSLPPAKAAVHIELGPPDLTYMDATRLEASRIPERSAIMFQTSGVLTGGAPRSRSDRALGRVTTADFFEMFDVPFLYGSGWSASADRNPEPVVVLSRLENEKLFGGENSVGRTVRWNDHPFRIIGVLDDWLPQPKFYDMDAGATAPPEQVFIPWGWGRTLGLPPTDYSCFKPKLLEMYAAGSECIFVQMWAELPSAEARQRMQRFMDNYWSDQHSAGRFPRPRNNRLTSVGEWLSGRNFLADGERLATLVAFAFLAVCLVNVVGLVLAKFLSGAASSGVRRALGASRRQIVLQHLVQAGVLALIGAVVGLVLAELALWAMAVWIATLNAQSVLGVPYEARSHSSLVSFAWAAVLAIVVALTTGLYPAWRIGRLPPGRYLKSQ
jgi:putative ABC transport system permease protein